jgi:hypothetical protein
MVSKTRKHLAKRRKIRKSNRRKMVKGGGCGCGNNNEQKMSLIKGGDPFGPPSFQGLPISTYYPLNTYANDPVYLQESSRLIPNIVSGGGGKSRRRRTRQNRRFLRSNKKKGGNLFGNWANYTSGENAISGTGMLGGSLMSANILAGNGIQSGLHTINNNMPLA